MTIGRYKSFNDINTEQIKTNLHNFDFGIGDNIYDYVLSQVSI